MDFGTTEEPNNDDFWKFVDFFLNASGKRKVMVILTTAKPEDQDQDEENLSRLYSQIKDSEPSPDYSNLTALRNERKAQLLLQQDTPSRTKEKLPPSGPVKDLEDQRSRLSLMDKVNKRFIKSEILTKGAALFDKTNWHKIRGKSQNRLLR